MPEESLKQKTAKSVAWSALNSGTTQLLNLVLGIFLARLLTPSDYGIVGVLSIFTMLAGNIQTCGFAHALINLKVDRLEDYNAVFWFNVITGAVLYGVLYCSAPLIARFFHQPCLVEVSRTLFLVFFISSFGIAHIGYMNKRLMNRETAIVCIIALTVSGAVGIMLAWMGKSYWSLVFQQLTYAVLITAGRYCYCPRLVSLHIDFSPLRSFFGFGMRIMLTNIANTLSNNVLTFIMGRLFPIHDVGNFSQANKWSTLASTTVYSTVDQIVQPVMVKAGGDVQRRKRVLRKLLRMTAFCAFPSMLGLALVSREFILVTIGPKWLDAVMLLRILCCAGAVIPIHHVYQNFMASIGRSDIYLYTNIALIFTQIAAVLLASSHGIQTMVATYVVVMLSWTLVWHAMAHRVIRLSVKDLLSDLLPIVVVTVAMVCVTWAVTRGIDHVVLKLCVRVVVAAVFYVSVMWLTRNDILMDIIAFVKERRQSAQSK